MKKIIVGLSMLVGCFACSMYCYAKSVKKPLPAATTEQTEPLQSAYTDPNKMIQVTPDKAMVVLKIKSNPTTGYMWFLSSYDSNLLTPVSRQYIPSKSDLVGAGGYVEWTFSVNKQAFVVPQLTHINLHYIRPWIVTAGHQQLNFTVAIEPGNSTAVKDDK